MKRNQKMKVLAFSMFAGMVAASAPHVKAAELEKFQNTVSQDQAQIVMSLNSSSTSIKPGDKFTVTLSLDELPDNGFGVGSISFKLAYDATKVEAATTTNKLGKTIPDVKAGPVGTALSMGTAAFGENGSYKTIAVGMCKNGDEATSQSGDVLSVEFTALDNVTPGSIEMFMVGNSTSDSGDNTQNVAGFSATGVKVDGETLLTDDTTPVYLGTNLDDLAAVVEAESVRFTDSTTESLDTVNKPTASFGGLLEIDPTGAAGNTITWTTSNPAVATVDQHGTVTAVGNGTAVITATVDGKSASKNVNVIVSPTSVDFDIDQDLNLDITTKPSLSLKSNVVVTPADAKVTSYDWSSSNPAVATVDANGTVTAVGNGQAEITVRYSDTLFDKITVKVTTSVASVSLDKSTVVLDVVEKTTDLVGYTLNPTTAQAREVTVTSSDPAVATAAIENGKVKVTAHKYGTAKITLTVDGKTATADVKVTVPLSAITLDKNTVTVYKGESETVKVSADPEGSAWESLAQSTKSGSGAKAEVNEQTGVVTITGLERGNSVISVYANNDKTGAFIKDVNVTVKENRVTKLTVTGQEEEFLRGKTQTLTTKYTTEEPETTHKTTDDTKITWSSSDPDVATVDQDGKVTAVSAGTATITAKMPGTANNIQTTYDVEVVEYPLEEVVIAEEDQKTLEEGLTVAPGESIAIPFEVKPENCTDTKEEIEEGMEAIIDYNPELVEVKVAYDPETGKGTITVTAKADGEGTVEIPVGVELDEDGEPVLDENDEVVLKTVTLKLTVATPVEENADTSDIPVAATAVVMIVSLGGIVITKKVLVK